MGVILIIMIRHGMERMNIGSFWPRVGLGWPLLVAMGGDDFRPALKGRQR